MSLTQAYPVGTESYRHPQAMYDSLSPAGHQFSRPEPRVAETSAKSSPKLAWTGSDLTPSVYIVSLNDKDRSSIADAIRRFKARKLQLPRLSPDTFPLSEELSGRLRRISYEVHHGRGFIVLRGLDPGKFINVEDKVIAFCGISSYVGNQRGTNTHGFSMVHIRSTQFDETPANEEKNKASIPPEKPHPLKYHSDRFFGDVLALYLDCLGASGGDQYLASFQTIHDRLSRGSPAALKSLETPDWPCLSHESNNDARDHHKGEPIVFNESGKSIIQLVHKPFEEAGEDPLSAEQRWALDKVQETAEEVGIKLDRQVGDIQFINNLILLHARDDYFDTRDNVRCSLRLSLKDETYAWKKPESHKRKFDERFSTGVENQYIPVRHDDPLPTSDKPKGDKPVPRRWSHG